jgi:hypothetical protein
VCSLAGRDLASFPRKLLGGLLLNRGGAVDCVPLSWDGRGIIFKEAVLLTRPQQRGGVNKSQGS